MAKDERPLLKKLSGRGSTPIGREPIDHEATTDDLDKSKAQLKEEAFMFWLTLGGGASNPIMKAVATFSHRSLRTVKSWYAEDRWKERHKTMKEGVLEAHGKMFENAVVMERHDLISITDEAIRQWAVLLKNGKIVLTRVEDYERLIKIRKMILGESTSELGVTIEIKTAVPRPQVIDMGKASPELPSEIESELRAIPTEVGNGGEQNEGNKGNERIDI